MNKEEIIQEFERWILAGRPDVWIRETISNEWLLVSIDPTWDEKNIYIVNDKHAEIRRSIIDNPDLEIEFKNCRDKEWLSIPNPTWSIFCEYRIKPEPKIERRWRWARNYPDGHTDVTGYMNETYAKGRGYRIVGWYKLENDFLDVKVEE